MIEVRITEVILYLESWEFRREKTSNPAISGKVLLVDALIIYSKMSKKLLMFFKIKYKFSPWNINYFVKF